MTISKELNEVAENVVNCMGDPALLKADDLHSLAGMLLRGAAEIDRLERDLACDKAIKPEVKPEPAEWEEFLRDEMFYMPEGTDDYDLRMRKQHGVYIWDRRRKVET